jgi:hypothetical protein
MGDHAAIARRSRTRSTPGLNRVRLPQIPVMLRKQRKGNVPDTAAATFTRLSGAPLISMMQSSHLGNSLDTPVLWLVHRPS